MTIKLALYDDAFSIRGTTRAILAYAEALYDNLGIETRVFANRHSTVFSNELYKLQVSKGKIDICLVSDPSEVFASRRLAYDYIYHITGGYNKREGDFISSSIRPVLLHQVGFEAPRFSHSNDSSKHRCAYVSHWQNLYFANSQSNVVPHIVERDRGLIKPFSLRARLGIPSDSIVLGRHGGIDTWNLKFANEAIVEAVNRREDLHLVFLNTRPFSCHRQLHFLPSTANNSTIESYLSACDAMLHARWEGETFGLACAEFLVRNKPIITWAESRERNHILMADSSITTYNTKEDLLALLLCLDYSYIKHKADLIPASIMANLSPEAVSKQFHKAFLAA